VTFAVEGTSYECELCEPHLAEFREAMEVWSSHSRTARTARASQGASSRAGRRRTLTNGAPSPSEVREWARSQGLEVSTRGRVPAELLAAFEAAH
ncbi:MAG: Lsr2 family protein, partial [Actinomycetota bacterium]|nr:Lsr2 family protein [Actinomycetota bacterium]